MSFRLLIPFVPALAVAQTGPTASISIDANSRRNGAIKSAQSADDYAWMLVS